MTHLLCPESTKGNLIDEIEEQTLDQLGVLIIDRQAANDIVVPNGDIRFWVHHNTELIGTISIWVIHGNTWYYPKDYNNPETHKRYPSLSAAALSLLPLLSSID